MKSMLLSFAAGAVLSLAVLLLFNLTPRANGATPQRYMEMHAALRHLEQARDNLTNAAHDFHGHRAKALEHTNKAIEEVNKGIEAGEGFRRLAPTSKNRGPRQPTSFFGIGRCPVAAHCSTSGRIIAC